MDQDSKLKLTPLMSGKIFLVLAGLLILVRFFHFDDLIDSPHAWRQCDTANYILDFHQNGIDLFNPAVCWMGHHKTLILEFPLPEALVAILYNLLGKHVWLARLFFLFCFTGASWFLWLILRKLLEFDLAVFSTLIFMSMPLSLFYSRAIHIDFFAVFMAHGMVYFWLNAMESQKAIGWVCGALFAVPAFLVKAPYAFYFALPLLTYCIYKKQLVKSLVWVPLAILPLITFYFWQSYASWVNSLAPDWEYISGYRKFDQNLGWYFGSMDQRLNIENWKKIFYRFIPNVNYWFGILLMTLGLLRLWKKPERNFFFAWIAGVLIYFLVFFNLNLVHDYYQIPFLSICAVLLASGIFFLTENVDKLMKGTRVFLAYLALAFIIGTNLAGAEKNYYKTEHQAIIRDIGLVIQDQTPEDALPIITYRGFDTRNPLILYRARRNGWSIPVYSMNPETITRLEQEENATHFIFVDNYPPPGKMATYLLQFPNHQVFELKNTNLKVFIWTL